MKIFVTIFFSLLSGFLFAQADTTKLVNTVKEFHQALVNKNTVAINQQTDKALSYGHSNGWVQTKSDLMKDLENGVISYQEMKEDSMTVSMNGDLANVRFIATVAATMRGAASNFRLKVLEVWVIKGKRWILFARQAVKG